MQQLGNMKDNFDDLSDPEQFACLVNARQFLFYKLKNKNFETQMHFLLSVGYIQFTVNPVYLKLIFEKMH